MYYLLRLLKLVLNRLLFVTKATLIANYSCSAFPNLAFVNRFRSFVRLNQKKTHTYRYLTPGYGHLFQLLQLLQLFIWNPTKKVYNFSTGSTNVK